jgi:hypothetical protein
MTQPNIYVIEGGGFQNVWRINGQNFFLKSDINFIRRILLSNWIKTNQLTSIWNLGSDAYFECTSCYFEVVTLFIKNLFWVRLPYLLIIRRLYIIVAHSKPLCVVFVHWIFYFYHKDKKPILQKFSIRGF